MKRVIITYVWLICLAACSAKPSGNIFRAMMLSDINQHRFSSALLNLKDADIEYDIDDENVYIPYFDEFIVYARERSVSTKTINDLMLYKAELFVSYAYSYYWVGNYEEMEHYLKESNNIIAEVYSMGSEEYINAVAGMANMFIHSGQFNKAQETFEKVLPLAQKKFGTNSIKYTSVYMDYATVFESKGDDAKALAMYKSCENIFISKNALNTLEYSVYLNNVGKIYTKQGNYNLAEECYIKNLKVLEKLYGSNHIEYAQAASNMGSLYLSIGDTQRAIEYYSKAINIYKSQQVTTLDIYAQTLQGLAISYRRLGEYETALKYGEECKSVIVTNYSSQSPQHIAILDVLSSIYYYKGEDEKSLQYLEEALQLGSGIYGKESSEYALMCEHLAILNLEAKHFDSAERYCRESMAIREKSYGKQHMQYLASIYCLANIYSEQGRYKDAYKLFIESRDICKNIVNINFAFLSEVQRQIFLDYMEENFMGNYDYFVLKNIKNDNSLTCFAYDNALWRKGLLLSTTSKIQKLVLSSNDKELIRIWNSLADIRKKLDVDNSRADPDPTQNRNLEKEAEDLEKSILKRINLEQQVEDYSWSDVKAQLSNSSIAIEILEYTSVDEKRQYYALLLKNNSKYPLLISLFSEDEIRPLIHSEVDSATNSTYSYEYRGRKLKRMVWDKIISNVNKGDTIYFSSSGLLHQLAIENLPYDKTRTIGDVYKIVRLSSTREIVRCKWNIQPKTAVLYGGIKYDMSADAILAESKKYADARLSVRREIVDSSNKRGRIEELSGTKEEVENIVSLLKQSNLKVQLFTSTYANEESFKVLSGKGKNILHIATHGFYWADSTAQKKDYFASRMMVGDNSIPSSIDPLYRCGLLFAGAQTAWNGHSAELPDGVQDGILTAKEISILDFRSADLVVLSACETAKGEITGDGVFGLQRAFKQAGAQTIVMSLWPVNDAATQLLMTEFYRNWITNHQSKREAFRNAQNTVRAKFEKPVYWAGFIMLD